MLAVALVEASALVATALVFASVVRALIRQAARERELLLNQIMHLAGRTWTPPPAEQWQPPAETEDEYADFGLTGPVALTYE